MNKVKHKPKRHLRKRFILLPIFILIGSFFAFYLPFHQTNEKLLALGYTNSQIKVIRQNHLQKQLIQEEIYSQPLSHAIDQNTFNAKYTDLYLYASKVEDRFISNDDLLLYHRLLDMGYEQDQIQNLFSNLYFWEITPLLTFDYQWNEQEYIDDCLQHRSENSVDQFILSRSYRKAYKTTYPQTDLDQIQALINKTYYAKEDLTFDDIIPISTQYAAINQQLRKEAADQAIAMIQKSVEEKQAFFIRQSYQDYSSLLALYNRNPQSLRDRYGIRPLFDEHILGLSINVAKTYGSEDFIDSSVYTWIKEHCVEYGFILRYPPSKKSITDIDEIDHLRYLGKELAQKVSESHLTYDEYYLLYLAPFHDSKYQPDDQIFNH